MFCNKTCSERIQSVWFHVCVNCSWNRPTQNPLKDLLPSSHFIILLWPVITECRLISRDKEVCLVQVVKWYLSLSKNNNEKNVEMFVCYFRNNPTKLKYIDVLALSKYLFLIGKLQIFKWKKKDTTNYMRLSQYSMSAYSGNSKVTWFWLIHDLLHHQRLSLYVLWEATSPE